MKISYKITRRAHLLVRILTTFAVLCACGALYASTNSNVVSPAVGGLEEHAEPIIAVLLTVMGVLFGLIAWALKRILAKIESNIEELWKVVRDNEKVVTKLEKDFLVLETEHNFFRSKCVHIGTDATE